MPRTSPRNSEISLILFQAYATNRNTRITSPIGSASRLRGMARMVSQEVAAKASAKAPMSRRAARQTARSRRLNWSRCLGADGDSAESTARGVESFFIGKVVLEGASGKAGDLGGLPCL